MTTNLARKLISWEAVYRVGRGPKVMRDRSLSVDTHVYHMLPWRFARMIFDNRRLRLSPVGRWDDPYEKYWCTLLFNRTTSLSGLHAYGVCWTTGRHDEPRWRMAAFRRCEPIVRIRCRVDAILKAGHNLIRAKPGALYFGRVRYERESTLKALSQSITSGERKEATPTAAGVLLRKRKAFRFEREVRLLWLDREAAQDEVYLDIDPMAVIDQVMTSPHATAAERRDIKKDLRAHGIEPLQSLLMRAPLGF